MARIAQMVQGAIRLHEDYYKGYQNGKYEFCKSDHDWDFCYKYRLMMNCDVNI